MTRQTNMERVLLKEIIPLMDMEKVEARLKEMREYYGKRPEWARHLQKYEKPNIELIIDYTDQPSYRWFIQLSWNSNRIFSFCLGPYPACCAMQMFYDFYIDNQSKMIPVENIGKILDLFFRNISPKVGGWATRRIIAMMVSHGEMSTHINHQFDEKIVSDGRVNYFEYYDYFKKQKKCHEKLMWNQNTGNVIHELEVLFDPEQFPQRSPLF